MPVARTASGVRLSLRVTPKARRAGIGGIAEDADGGAALKVSVTAAPEDGKANDAVIRLLAKTWHLPKSSFSVISGATGRRKVLAISGDPAALADAIGGWIARRG